MSETDDRAAMTVPTPEQMRALADAAANLTVDNDWDATVIADVLTTLRAAADEVDRLRFVMDNAPHDSGCQFSFLSEDMPRRCTCWKADAL